MFKKQIKRHKKYYGFTLVELIIVITILAILATISFVSFSGYTANSRDSNRLFSLKEISKSLTMQKEITGNFPQPDEVYAKGGIPNLDNELFSVGLIGKNVSNYVKLGGIPLDPKTGSEYLYGLTRDNKNFQIAGTLENLQSSIIIEKAYANSGLEAVVEGDYKGVIRFSTGSSNYIGNIPSLIFSRTGTYSIEKRFVINKGKNLPYSLDGKNLGTGLTPELVLKELHNKDNLALTGVVITNPKSETEIKQISDKLGVSDMIVADSLGNKQYTSSGGSSGGGTPTKDPNNCLFDGRVILSGQSVEAYETASVTNGNTCNKQIRTCNDSNLSGSFIFADCTIGGLTCPIDQYSEDGITCTSVGIGYYSENGAITRTACTNKPANSTYITSGNGINNCSYTCNTSDGYSGPNCVLSEPKNIGDSMTLTFNIGGTNYDYSVQKMPDNKIWTTQNMRHPANSCNSQSFLNSSTSRWCGPYSGQPTDTVEGWLYQFTAAIGNGTSRGITNSQETTNSVCSSLGTGWRLPTDSEFITLENSLGCTNSSNTKRRCDGLGWTSLTTNKKIGGLMNYLPGSREIDGLFGHRGSYGNFWTSTQNNSYLSWSRNLYSSFSMVYRSSVSLAYGYSVVCVKD